MVPAGYMAKRISKNPEWLGASQVADVYSVSDCVSEDFADYIDFWKHNGYWLFDSPEIIRCLAKECSVDLSGTSLFYYEAHDLEFDEEAWHTYSPEQSFPTHVIPPSKKMLEGFDVVTFYCRNAPEHSPLSCHSLAKELPTNAHCLLTSFEQAYSLLSGGAFKNSEPDPYQIFAVYSVPWS